MRPGEHDRWTAASAYETFMGRWSRQLARRFVSWLELPPDLHWLDVGCGTGALTNAISTLAEPASVVGCDPAEPFIEFARSHAPDRASFVVAGVDRLPSHDGGFGCVGSLLALNFFPDAHRAIDAMCDRTTSGGIVAACVWDYAGRMEFLRFFWDVAVALDAAASSLDEGQRFPLCRPDVLGALFESGSLGDVRVDAIELPTVFASFDEYWQSLQGRTGPAPAYIASLDPERRAALARELTRNLPATSTGGIELSARAWVVRGARP